MQEAFPLFPHPHPLQPLVQPWSKQSHDSYISQTPNLTEFISVPCSVPSCIYISPSRPYLLSGRSWELYFVSYISLADSLDIPSTLGTRLFEAGPSSHQPCKGLGAMGGSAFTTPVHGLSTPRMPPHVYREVMAACHAKLKELYVVTASPIESPAKEDFGDIDILVSIEKPATTSPETDKAPSTPSDRTTRDQLVLIGEKLQARHSVIHSPPVSANFAVPWPTDLVHDAEEEQDIGERFIQVDVRICKDEDQVNWVSETRMDE